MFDSLTRRRRMYEHLLGLDDDELDDEELDGWDDLEEEERYYQDQIDDGESPLCRWPASRPTSNAVARRCRRAGSSTGPALRSWCGRFRPDAVTPPP